MDIPYDPEKNSSTADAGNSTTDDGEITVVRAVAFPDADNHAHDHEEKAPRGVEMRQHMTLEEIQLAAAGYEHLEQEKSKGQTTGTKGGELDKDVDISEHQLPINDLADLLKTAFEVK